MDHLTLGIDLGSNTLRAVIMDCDFQKFDEFEFIIGAAKQLSKTGKISQEALISLKNALKIIGKKYPLKNALAYATAAFRKANNTKEIFQELKEEFDINFKVIDPKTEAKLSVLGMKMALRKLGNVKENAYIDLGGASCELSFRDVFKSYDFGIISFYEKTQNFSPFNTQAIAKKFLNKKPYFLKKLKDKKLKLHFLIKDKELLNIAFKAFDEVWALKKQLKAFGIKNIVVNSGVPTSLCAFKLGLDYENYEAKKINGRKLNPQEFLDFALKLWNMPESQAQILVGSMRKKYLCAGCLLFFALFEKHKIVVVDEGLREGIIFAKALNLLD